MEAIYCHFLDRELANVAGYHGSARRAAAGLIVASILSEPPAFASLSGVHEAVGSSRLHSDVLPMLIDAGLFASTSDISSGEEFLVSRRRIYAHDRRRYQFYFNVPRKRLKLFTPTLLKETSATSALVDSLVHTLLALPPTAGDAGNWGNEAADLAQERLDQRENQAITFALFRPSIDAASSDPDGRQVIAFGVRRAISIAYTKHQMSVVPGSRVIPGMWELGKYDRALAVPGPEAIPSMPWMLRLLKASGARELRRLLELEPASWERWIGLCLGPRGAEVRERLVTWRRSRTPTGGLPANAAVALQANLARTPLVYGFDENLVAIARALWPRNVGRRYAMSNTVMVQCVNDNEREGILLACRSLGMVGSGGIVGTYAAAETLGSLAGQDVILVRSRAGSVGPLSAQGVVVDAIDEFDPKLVAAVGVAAGLKIVPSAESPTVIIASRATDYERVRLGVLPSGEVEVRERGDVGNPDPILLGKLRVVADGMQIPSREGQILCGEKLVDLPEFRAELRKRFPDALGVEMEASGVAGACARRNIPWLLLKGVSDSGDGSKRTFHGNEDLAQVEAARCAMMILLEGVRQNFL